MARRTVLILVEGPTDADVLVPPVRRRYRGTRNVDGVEFHFDVTTIRLFPENARAAGMRSCHNPKEAIRDRLRQYTESGGGCPWARISHIVHVVDLDGAYVNDSHIVHSPANRTVGYTETRILTANVPLLRKRNEEKSRQLDMLRAMRSVSMGGWKVPYRMFYMSRNLEHAFLGDVDVCSSRRKERYAAQLNAAFADDNGLFEQVIEKLWIMHGSLGWEESWRYVKEECHSLERGSNFHLLGEFLTNTEPGRQSKS